MLSVVAFAMLKPEITKKIEEFVYAMPRTIQDIALLLKVNWRTADAYVERISKEQGTLGVKTFRGGTKGALKIVFWRNTERPAASEAQEQLLKKIEAGRKKDDFSPLDIYQFVDKKKRRAFSEVTDAEEETRDKNIIPLLRQASSEVYIFSGNLSLANLVHGKISVLDVLEELARRNVNIKILTRIDVAGIENIKKVLALNQRVGRNAIEIRYAEQPLRAIVIDTKVARLREVKSPEKYRTGELKGRTYIYYELYEEDWILWLQKVFWHFFRPAVDARKRIEDLMTIEKLK